MSSSSFIKTYAKAALLFSLSKIQEFPGTSQLNILDNHSVSYLIEVDNTFKINNNFLGVGLKYFEVCFYIPQANNIGFIKSSSNINNTRCKILNYQLITPILKLRTINNRNDVLLEDIIYNEGKNYDDEIFKEIVYSNTLFRFMFQ